MLASRAPELWGLGRPRRRARFRLMHARRLCMLLTLPLAGCVSVPFDPEGRLPVAGLETARYVSQYCALDAQGRNGQSEALRRALWPNAQVIILCDR